MRRWHIIVAPSDKVHARADREYDRVFENRTMCGTSTNSGNGVWDYQLSNDNADELTCARCIGALDRRRKRETL